MINLIKKLIVKAPVIAGMLVAMILLFLFTCLPTAHADGQGVLVQQGRGTLYGAWAVKTIGTDKVAVSGTVSTGPSGSSTVGTGIACNTGTSPCTVSNSAADVLSANTSRKSCTVCAIGVVDLYCKRATAAGSAASSSNADFILNAGSAALKTGGCYSCDSNGVTWTGALNCIASAASAVVDTSVMETQ